LKTGNTSTTQTIPAQPRPAWRTALVALAVLFAISEMAYLLIGLGAKSCSDDAANCRHIVSWFYEIFITHAVNEIQMEEMVVRTSFGLPGFNNLFYVILGNIMFYQPDKFLLSAAASVIVGFLALWGYLATSTGRGAMMKLLLAIIFAIGWFVLYNNAEASVYDVDVFATAMRRAAEIPIAAISLLLVSLLTRRST
jgi:hypothetical protein